MKKIHAHQLTLKHIHAKAYKRKEFDNEQKFLRLKDSAPPDHNFSNSLSLIATEFLTHRLWLTSSFKRLQLRRYQGCFTPTK